MMERYLAKDSVVENLRMTSKGKLFYDTSYDPQTECFKREQQAVIRMPMTSPANPSMTKTKSKNYRMFHKQINDNGRDMLVDDDIIVGETAAKIDVENNALSQQSSIITRQRGLNASSFDIKDLLMSHVMKIEEDVKAEMRIKKQDFLTGVERLKSERCQLYTKDASNNQVKYRNEINVIENLQNQNQGFLIKNNELKTVHDTRKTVISKNNERIKIMANKISTIKRNQEEKRQKNLALSKELEKLMLSAREIYKSIENAANCSIDEPELLQTIKDMKDDAFENYTHALKVIKIAIDNQDQLEDTYDNCQNLPDALKSIDVKIGGILTSYNVRKKEEERKAQEMKAAEEKRKEEEKKLEMSQRSNAAETVLCEKGSSSNLVNKESISAFVSPEAFRCYDELLRYHQEFVKSYMELTSLNNENIAVQKEKNAARFRLTAVINTPINSISDQSPSHLIDKIDRLTKLLKGESVRAGDKTVSLTDHPNGIAYCKDAAAKKLVRQGADQISSNFKSAFTYAAVALGLWAEHPDVGNLILAHFYIACPYLVPYYIPRTNEQSVEDYYRLLGYKVDGKEIEPEEKYLKKLSGIVRLYAAIVQSAMPPYLSSIPHPHGIHNGWTWLSRLLNLEPLKTITATVIFDFLEVAGHELSKTYGKQFRKMLQLLLQYVVPKIDSITPADEKASITRLKNFLERCIKSGSIPIPSGYLSPKWWKQ